MEEVSVRDIANERYIERLHCEFGKEFREFFLGEGLELNVVFQCEREDWIQSMVRVGMGVALIPQYSVLHPGLKTKSITDPALSRIVEFVVSANLSAKSALSLFVEAVKNYQWPKT